MKILFQNRTARIVREYEVVSCTQTGSGANTFVIECRPTGTDLDALMFQNTLFINVVGLPDNRPRSFVGTKFEAWVSNNGTVHVVHTFSMSDIIDVDHVVEVTTLKQAALSAETGCVPCVC